MRRLVTAVWLVAAIGGTLWVASVFASADPSAESSENMRLIANYRGEPASPGQPASPYRTGTDMAFWGDLAVVSHLDQGTASPSRGGFRLLDISDPRKPTLVGKFTCPGDQSDVSIWKDLVILSVDKPTNSIRDSPNDKLCPTVLPADENETNWEGLRLISISDRQKPRIVKTVKTQCGSHTNTIVPDPRNDRLYVYVLSYPLAGRYNPADKMLPLAAGGPGCNAADHGLISVVEVKLSDPTQVSVKRVPMRDQGELLPIGCHDVTVFLEHEIAAAACLTETQLWDIADPANPKRIPGGDIPNPEGMDLSHSTVFSNDGETLVIGAELGGAVASPGCIDDGKKYAFGGLFFYDVRDKKGKIAPKLAGTYKLPRQQVSLFCTAHLFNVVPTNSKRDILVSSWYTGAASVIDFTDASKPEEIAHYVPRDPVAPDPERTDAAGWAAYWYRGHVYMNNFDEDVNSVFSNSRGLDVFKVDHKAVRVAVDLPRLNPQVQEPIRGRSEVVASGGNGRR